VQPTTEEAVEASVSEAPEGNPEEFVDLVRRHQSMVFGMAYSSLRDRSAAEEVAQDVFLDLHRNLASLQSPAHVVNWLRRVTAHRVIDRRRKFRFLAPLIEIVREPVAPETEHDPMLSETLGQLIGSLPAKQRMVVILRFQEDLDVADIAQTLDISERKVRSHLQWSLALLREKLSRRGMGVFT
jgi:RNA polymerase sigma-70 factor (ECF subfamily)